MRKASLAFLVVLVLLASTARAACTAVAFEPRIDHPINTGSPYVGGVADANVDGRDDVTIYFNDSRGFRTYLRNSDMSLTGGPLYATQGGSDAATGDIDGDGVPDVVQGGSVGMEQHLKFFQGNGDGSYTPRGTFAQPSSPYEIEIADLNNDGVNDIVASHANDLEASVLLQTTPWTFVAAPELSGYRVRSVADLDGDGNRDVMLAAIDGDLLVHYGNGDGTFDPVQTIVLPKSLITYGPASVAASDFNSDGRLDLAAGIVNLGAAIMINDGARTFHHAETVAPDAGARTVKAADLNADGRNDLAVSSFGGFFTALANADGTFAPAVFWPISELGSGINANDGFQFEIGDFRGDGRTDLVGRVRDGSSWFVATFLNACVPPPTITSVNPVFGPEAGGATVTITGTSLSSTTHVLFGMTPATIVSITPASVTVETPHSPPNFVDVTVTTSGGSATLPNAYRFVGVSLTTVTAETEPIVAGVPFTLVATVTPMRTGGTVTLTEGGNTLGAAPVVNGRAAISVTFASIAPRTFDAQFGGTPILDPSTGSGTFRAYLPVTMSLAFSPPVIEVDTSYRVTATLDPAANGGTVTFTVDGAVAGVANVIDGVAFLDLPASTPGAHTIEAAFSGFGDYAAASAVAEAHVVGQIPTLSEIGVVGLMLGMLALGLLRARS